MTRAVNFNEFKALGIERHKGKYSYHHDTYKSLSSKTKITCPEHGDFWQLGKDHLKTKGCKLCSYKKLHLKYSQTTDDVISQFVNVHGNLYDYSLVKYHNNHTKVKIKCSVHGVFSMSPAHHKNGHGCKKCVTAINSKERVKTAAKEFPIRANEVHGSLYDYSLSEYKGTQKPLKIVCPSHGSFMMRPANHVSGKQGCPQCGHRRKAKFFKDDLATVKQKFNKVHQDLYDYSLITKYENTGTKVEIFCNVHQRSFWQRADDHLQGKGCPACSNQESQPERELADFCEQMGFEVIPRSRDLIPPKEIDIYLPEKNLAIEYNGLIWHSELYKPTDGKVNQARRHLEDKRAACAELGIRLIHINSNENLEVIKRTLAVITGYDEEKIFARKCKVSKLEDPEQIDSFLNKHHIQGTVPSKTGVYGLTHNNQLVAVMVFSRPTSKRGKNPDGMYELRRYSSLCRITGGASRLLKAFLNDTPECSAVISYSDNRWFTGGMYEALGFIMEENCSPDYSYVKSMSHYPKNHFTRTRMQTREGFTFDSTLSERDNCWNNGYYRVWDCGKKRWKLIV